MDTFLIVLFILIVFVVLIAIAVFNNCRERNDREEGRGREDYSYTPYTIASPVSTSKSSLPGDLDSHRPEDLIALGKGNKTVTQEPKFEYGNDMQSEPVARQGDYVSEKSYSSRAEKSEREKENVPLYAVYEQKSDHANSYGSAKSDHANSYPSQKSEQPNAKSDNGNGYPSQKSDHGNSYKEQKSEKEKSGNSYKEQKSERERSASSYSH